MALDYYNKTNPANFALAGWPNLSDDKSGWGMCQIDTNSYGDGIVPTAVVWDWRTNVNEMARILQKKREDHNTWISSQKRLCQTNGWTWVDPPADATIYGVTLPVEQWGVIVLYNGVDTNSIPLSEGLYENGTPRPPFRSPWKFYPDTGEWKFYDNKKKFASQVADMMKQMQTGQITIRE